MLSKFVHSKIERHYEHQNQSILLHYKLKGLNLSKKISVNNIHPSSSTEVILKQCFFNQCILLLKSSVYKMLNEREQMSSKIPTESFKSVPDGSLADQPTHPLTLRPS